MATATVRDTRQAAAIAQHWIDGRWRDSAEHEDSINPATGEVIARYARQGGRGPRSCSRGAQKLPPHELETRSRASVACLMLVFDDADLDAALPKLEKALTVFAGQFCTTGSRLLVQSGIADRVRRQLTERLTNVKVGPASEPTSDMGPMIDKVNVARVNQIVEDALAAGAKAIVRGGPVTEGPLSQGAIYRRPFLEVTDSRLPIVQEEPFGPVLTMQVFDTEAEAVALANDSEYGVAASF